MIEFQHKLPAMKINGVRCGTYNNRELGFPSILTTTDPNPKPVTVVVNGEKKQVTPEVADNKDKGDKKKAKSKKTKKA